MGVKTLISRGQRLRLGHLEIGGTLPVLEIFLMFLSHRLANQAYKCCRNGGCKSAKSVDNQQLCSPPGLKADESS